MKTYMKQDNIRGEGGIAVGVVLYKNSKKQLVQLIKAVRGQTYNGEITLLCWNNCGSDYSWVRSLDNDLVLFNFVDNLGFGGGHNSLMAQQLHWDYYVALNPDGILHREALEQMQIMSDGVCLVEAKQVPHEHPKAYNKITYETNWCSGACLMISKQTYNALGGFADEFFMYCEDVDLSWRVRQHGGKCLFADKAWFYHDVEQNDHRLALQLRMHESGVILATKWGAQEKATKWKSKLGKFGATEESMSLLDKTLEGIEVLAQPNVSDFEHNFSFSKVRW